MTIEMSNLTTPLLTTVTYDNLFRHHSVDLSPYSEFDKSFHMHARPECIRPPSRVSEAVMVVAVVGVTVYPCYGVGSVVPKSLTDRTNSHQRKLTSSQRIS